MESLYLELLEAEVRRLRAEKASLSEEMVEYQRDKDSLVDDLRAAAERANRDEAEISRLRGLGPQLNRIAAIKRLRLILPSLGLKEAKDVVDAALAGNVG